jgi:hypothetical protein
MEKTASLNLFDLQMIKEAIDKFWFPILWSGSIELLVAYSAVKTIVDKKVGELTNEDEGGQY